MQIKTPRPVAWFAIFLFLLSAQMPASPMPADASETASQEDRLSEETVRRRADETETAIERARRDISAENAVALGIDKTDLEDRVRQWAELETAYDGLLTEIQKKAELEAEAAAEQRGLESGQDNGLPGPPYPLSTYDDLLVDSETLRQNIEITDMSLNAARRSMAESGTQLSNAQDQLERFIREKEPRQTPADRWVMEGLQLRVQLADTLRRLHLRRTENIQRQKQHATARAERLSERVEQVRRGLAYNDKDLEQQLAALAQKKEEVEKSLELLRRKKKQADQLWLKAQPRKQKTVSSSDPALIEKRLKALSQWRKTYQAAIDQHQEILRLNDRQQEVWKKRYALLKQAPDRTGLNEWSEQSQQSLSHFDRMLTVAQQRQNSLWRQTGLMESPTNTTSQEPTPNGNGELAKALRQLALYRTDYINALEAGRWVEKQLSREIDALLERRPITYQVEKLWSGLRSIWTYQVWVIDDRPLTVQKIVVALAILLMGIMGVKLVIRRIANRILTRPQIRATTAATIEKLLLYLGYVMVALFALRMVNIPLAAFAFLGGAIAIGLGFGAQNLINNFISGFIIMGEQPINIGDLIEVEGVLGQVEDIGARCTRIRTGDNIQILVPNSSFLEKNITNWTLSDRLIRANVDVGVAYGSPVETVERLLLQACREMEKIRNTPEPFVLFTEFGDNALLFKVLFWIHVERIVERRIIESRLRFKIDALFRQSGIVIAFPQRDVHLDTLSPLKVEVLGRSEEEPHKGSGN